MLRQQQLITWLHSQFPDAPFELAPASVDASFRRYFRVTFSDRTLIVMDAPPQHEDCRPFIHVAQLFSAAGVHVPQVLAQDLEQGFLLLSDLGNTTYLQALCGSNANTARELYGAAIDALISIQLASRENDLPPYDEALLLREMRLFPAWYIAKHLAVTLSAKQNATLENSFQRIVQNNLAQPRVYVHRDYHSRNLMYIERPLLNPLPRIPSPQSSDGTTGETTSHLTNPAKDAGQVIGYSHSTRPSRSDGQVHPQGVRRGCTKGRQSTTQQAACGIDTKELKPQQHTQAGYPRKRGERSEGGEARRTRKTIVNSCGRKDKRERQFSNFARHTGFSGRGVWPDHLRSRFAIQGCLYTLGRSRGVGLVD